MREEAGRAPGLEWRPRKGGADVPYWTARRDLVKRGYTPKTVNLAFFADSPEALAARCHVLQAEMLEWASGAKQEATFDGTIGSLIRLYQSHEDSPIHDKRQDTRRFYLQNCAIIEKTVGSRRVTAITGIDVRRWHKNWKEPIEPGGPERLRRAKACIQTLQVALAFGQAMKLPGCRDLRDAIAGFEWPNSKPRRSTLTYAQASAFINLALEQGDIPHALAQAVMFECTLRQRDVIGEWIGDSTATGGIIFNGRRWDRGLVWGTHITPDLILTKQTSKTGAEAVFDLTRCGLVMHVLERVPIEKRVGPMIMHVAEGRPFLHRHFARVWRQIATAAGIPASVWNMDSRAGGITEGREAGASLEDLRHHATHASISTTARYDRQTPETTAKIADLRAARRAKQNAVGT